MTTGMHIHNNCHHVKKNNISLTSKMLEECRKLTKGELLHQENALAHKSVVAMASKSG